MSKNSKCTGCGDDCNNECFSTSCWDKCTGCYDTCQLGCFNTSCSGSCGQNNCMHSKCGVECSSSCAGGCAYQCSESCWSGGDCKSTCDTWEGSYACHRNCTGIGCTDIMCKGGCGFYLNHLYSFIL